MAFLLLVGLLAAGLAIEQNRGLVPFALALMALMLWAPFFDRGRLVRLVGDSVIRGGKQEKSGRDHQATDVKG